MHGARTITYTKHGPLLLPCQRPERIRSQVGGFGNSASGKSRSGQSKKVVDIKQVGEVLEEIWEGDTRPIDPEEAAEGRIDYATVENWTTADGTETSLDDLKIKNFVTDASRDQSSPFYYRLTKTLERLQLSGELEIETGELLPFEEWKYTPDTYRTSLLNVATAHLILEDAIKRSLDSIDTVEEMEDFPVEALRFVSSERHLDRGKELMKDYNNFVENTPEIEPYDMRPERSVTQYEGHVYKMTKRALDHQNRAEQIPALCQLITHAYVLRIMHFTSGTRIAAAAVDKLNLPEKKAITAYEIYPDDIEDPVTDFVKDINKIGDLLKEEVKAFIFEELQAAFKLTSVFYAPLARNPATPTTEQI